MLILPCVSYYYVLSSIPVEPVFQICSMCKDHKQAYLYSTETTSLLVFGKVGVVWS